MTLYKYYTLERPPAPGTVPSWGLRDTESYDEKRDCCMGGVVSAWCWALYNRRLDMKEIRDYELAYGGEVERCRKWM